MLETSLPSFRHGVTDARREFEITVVLIFEPIRFSAAAFAPHGLPAMLDSSERDLAAKRALKQSRAADAFVRSKAYDMRRIIEVTTSKHVASVFRARRSLNEKNLCIGDIRECCEKWLELAPSFKKAVRAWFDFEK
jgi:hypothetical protein